MDNVIMLTFWGKMHLFENNVSQEECISLQALADSDRFIESIDFSDIPSILPRYLRSVEEELGISLKPINITHIIRIKK